MGKKPFDSSTKHLIKLDPRAWIRLIEPDLPDSVPVRLEDADISSITAAVDKVVRVGLLDSRVFHFEPQVYGELKYGRRLLRYNVILEAQHDSPIRTVAVLMRPEADVKSNEVHNDGSDGSSPYWFRFDVIRVWELSAEQLAAGPLATLPLAPIANIEEPQLRPLLEHIEARVLQEAEPPIAAELFAAVFLLLGLRFRAEKVGTLIQGLMSAMKESSTYQELVRESEARGEARGETRGELKALRATILRQGTLRFGEPDAATRQRIEQTATADALNRLADRVIFAATWADLLAESP